MQETNSGLSKPAGRASSTQRAEEASALVDEQVPQIPRIPSNARGIRRRSPISRDQRFLRQRHNPPETTRPQEEPPQSRSNITWDRSLDGDVGSLSSEHSTLYGSDLRPPRSPYSAETFEGRSIRRRPPWQQVPSPLGRPSQTGSRDELNQRSTPLTLRDLGSDYTRYYVPFKNNSRSSGSTRVSSRSRNPSSHLAAPVTAATSGFSTPSDSTTRLVTEKEKEEDLLLIDDRLSAPYEEGPLWDDAAEDDDAMHLPHPDDDKLFMPNWKEYFKIRNTGHTVGVMLIILGLLPIFFGLPILAHFGVINFTAGLETPIEEMPYGYPPEEEWADVNDKIYGYLQNIRTTLIDPDTPDYAKEKIGEFGDDYELVFSDEFNDGNRTFYEGDDPFFFAPDIWYGATQDLEWYDPDAVTTWDGVLELRLDKFRNHGLNFRSGMLNSWNHLCFKGGIFEVSMSLPGPAGVHGLWPGVWALGNLGRPGYTATTDGTWPYTYQACDAGITPNQSSTDGLSHLPGQRLPSCTCPGEDHPTPGTGRGVPEIDIAEVSASWDGKKLPVATQSYQVAPFDIWYYPDYDFTAFPDHRLSYTNTYTGGPFQQAVSASTTLHHDWFDGKAYQRFSFEYVPGDEEGSHITWKVGGQTMFTLDARALGPNGNIQARQISQEPMSLVLNLGISESWSYMEWDKLVFPAVLRVDYVRWYQKKGEKMVTCDPPGYETTKYIKKHVKAYMNPNLTTWDQTGYGWPKHKLNNEC